MAGSFIGRWNWSTQSKPPTWSKLLINLYHIMLYRVHLTMTGIITHFSGDRHWLHRQLQMQVLHDGPMQTYQNKDCYICCLKTRSGRWLNLATNLHKILYNLRYWEPDAILSHQPASVKGISILSVWCEYYF
jgi:hypothetical protein